MNQQLVIETKRAKRSLWKERLAEDWRVFSSNPLGRIGLVLLTMFGLMAVCSYIPPLVDPMYNPMTGVDPEIMSSTGPSARHWLGTDFMGRDIFAQLLAGARVAFMVGVSAAFMSVVLGTAFGMTAGYMGGVCDTLLMRAADMIMVMPTLLVVLTPPPTPSTPSPSTSTPPSPPNRATSSSPPIASPPPSP